VVDVPGTAGSIAIGDTVQVRVIAAGCSLGGHWGEAYVDAFGAFLPGLSIAAHAPQQANAGSNLTTTYAVNNSASTSATNVAVVAPIPAQTTFVSLSVPAGASCTTPPVGGTGNVTCNVQKTWRKEVLVKILSKGKVTWPWGYARCITDLKFDRATLIKSMTLPEFEAQFDTHNIRCELEGEKEKYEVKLQIQPKVTFKQGKAVKASLNWGKIEAPTLAKTALWSATAADNSFGVLQSTVVEDINEFIHTKCMEAKEEWQGK